MRGSASSARTGRRGWRDARRARRAKSFKIESVSEDVSRIIRETLYSRNKYTLYSLETGEKSKSADVTGWAGRWEGLGASGVRSSTVWDRTGWRFISVSHSFLCRHYIIMCTVIALMGDPSPFRREGQLFGRPQRDQPRPKGANKYKWSRPTETLPIIEFNPSKHRPKSAVRKLYVIMAPFFQLANKTSTESFKTILQNGEASTITETRALLPYGKFSVFTLG